MKKNEEPYTIIITFGPQKEDPKIESFTCTCAAGKGFCQHTIGLLYSLSHYQLLGLKSILPIISKTSLPQVFFEMIFCSGIEIAVFSAEICLKIVSDLYIFSYQAFFLCLDMAYSKEVGWNSATASL